MAETTQANKELKNTGYEIFIGILSILSILNIILAYVFRQNSDLQDILYGIDLLLSVIFLADFTYRISTTSHKSEYFFRKFGWADLLASLPFPQAKILRVFRIVRVYRLLKEYGLKNIVKSLVKDRAGSALIILLLMGILVLEFGSLAILNAESKSPNANIKTGSDAVWYTLVTISTVGYGDRYPVTNPGRLIGSIIIIVGVGIFGTFTGYLANMFLSPAKKEETTKKDPSELTDAGVKLDELKQLLDDQEKTNAALKQRLSEIEDLYNPSS